MANWTRRELLLALNLYFETPFGKQHKTYAPIVALANEIGRTPSSVAMKLSNFTSLDPVENSRGIKGLSGSSKLDQQIWNEFQENKEALVVEIEEYLQEHVDAKDEEDILNGLEGKQAEKLTTIKTRRFQNFFRRVVIGSYAGRCCITGNPIPELLRASHIIPWSESEEERLNPCNGLCLVATFDAAFDRGLIAIDDSYRLLVGPKIKRHFENKVIQKTFLDREGKGIELPEKNLPDLTMIKWHREKIANLG